MTFTYDLGSSDSTKLAISRVRMLIPDTVQDGHLIEDEEISFFLSERNNHLYATAADLCMKLSRQFALKVTTQADGVKADHSQRAEVFAKRALELRSQVGGGISTIVLDKQDGWSDNADEAGETEHESRVIYIRA